MQAAVLLDWGGMEEWEGSGLSYLAALALGILLSVNATSAL